MAKKILPVDENIYDTDCPILYAMELIGQKWKLPILWYLHEKPTTRFNELKRRIPGITTMMLTKSLRELESCGLVNRRVYEVIPPKVEYSLTGRGKSLMPILDQLCEWGDENRR
mgnify:CR=1 FL=1